MSQVINAEYELFAAAMQRNATALLTLPSAGMNRSCKTRFLGDTDDGIWLEATADATPLLQELGTTQVPLQVAFTAGGRWLTFQTTVLRMQPGHQINLETAVDSVLVARPLEVKNVQRRAAYRVKPPSDGDLLVRAWVITEQAPLADRPQPSQEVKLEIRDLSVGGLGVRLLGPQSPRNPQSLVLNQRLRVTVEYREMKLVLEGRFRPEAKQDDGFICPPGIIFKKLESNLEGRQTLTSLTRIVGELQREEIRRKRLGL